MAGLVTPISAFPVHVARVFPRAHGEDYGLGLTNSIALDSTWALRFLTPPTLPSGTAKLRILSLCSVVTGNLVVGPQWASVAPEENPDIFTLNSEGDTTTTWAAGDSDVYKETLVVLDADTIVAGEVIVMDLVFRSTTTLAAASTHHVSIIWED